MDVLQYLNVINDLENYIENEKFHFTIAIIFSYDANAIKVKNFKRGLSSNLRL